MHAPRSAGHSVTADAQGRDEFLEGEDAGIAHLLPKVMVPFETKPGETPRKVVIQR